MLAWIYEVYLRVKKRFHKRVHILYVCEARVNADKKKIKIFPISERGLSNELFEIQKQEPAIKYGSYLFCFFPVQNKFVFNTEIYLQVNIKIICSKTIILLLKSLFVSLLLTYSIPSFATPFKYTRLCYISKF